MRSTTAIIGHGIVDREDEKLSQIRALKRIWPCVSGTL